MVGFPSSKLAFWGSYSFKQLLRITPQNSKPKATSAWYSKQPVFNGCFNWIIQNHYIIKMVVSPFPSIKIWLFRVPGDCLQSRKICFALGPLFLRKAQTGGESKPRRSQKPRVVKEKNIQLLIGSKCTHGNPARSPGQKVKLLVGYM